MLQSDGYSDSPNLAADVTEPSYPAVLKWMRTGSLPHVSYDCWARGNYTRRLLWHRLRGVVPLNVVVRSVGEIAWAYRRLALVGMPVDFIYTGPLEREGRVIHLYPCNTFPTYDAGWGYLAWLHEPVRIGGRRWHIITGTARPMPEAIVSWLAGEGATPFVRGEVFIAPAELIGFNPEAVEAGLDALSEINGGPGVSPDIGIGRTLLELELPYLDLMSIRALERFRHDHDAELVVFRSALRKLIRETQATGHPSTEIVEELRTAVAELQRSQKYSGLQRDILKLGGVFAIFSASIGMLLKQPSDITLTAFGFAGVNAAGLALLDLLKQARDAKATLAQNPCFVLWRLGVRKQSDVQMRRRVLPVPELSVPHHEVPRTNHWLCPPTNGFRFPFVRQSE